MKKLVKAGRIKSVIVHRGVYLLGVRNSRANIIQTLHSVLIDIADVHVIIMDICIQLNNFSSYFHETLIVYLNREFELMQVPFYSIFERYRQMLS